MRKGILLNDNFDLAINLKKDDNGLMLSGLIVGDSILQDATMVLSSRQGDLKEDPLLGVGLSKFIRGKYDALAIESRIRLHLTRAGIDYSTFKENIKIEINKAY